MLESVLSHVFRPPGEEAVLRVLETCVSRGNGLETVAVDLPLSWAHQMDTARVVFRNTDTEDMGWHISLQDGCGWLAADFPWWDHADDLLRRKPAQWVPIEAAGGSWSDVEQGWYVSVQARHGNAWVFRTDWDALLSESESRPPTLVGPGRIEIGSTEAWWSAVPLHQYRAAWSAAAFEARRLDPSST